MADAFKPVDANVIHYAKLAKPWINPLSLLDLRAAIKANAEEVVLEGRKYSITYHDNGQRIWLQVERAPAPCGWFTRDSLLLKGRLFDGL